jgi:hypothetical protein
MNKITLRITSLLFAVTVSLFIAIVSGLPFIVTACAILAMSVVVSKVIPSGIAFFTLTNLNWNQGQQNMGGIIGQIFYCPIEDILTFPEASAAGKLDTIESFVCKPGKKFISIYHTAETGKLDDTTVGERDGKSKENLLEFLFPGSKQDVAEFERFALNTPCVVICKDTSGNYRALGIGSFDDQTVELTGDIPAYLESSSGTTGAARADRRGKTFQFKHSANHEAIYYKGTIPLTPAAE